MRLKSRNGGSVSMGVIREKKEQNINLTLPERKESGEVIEEEESVEGPLMDAESAVELSRVGSRKLPSCGRRWSWPSKMRGGSVGELAART